MHTVLIKVTPHPQFEGDWLVQCDELLPNALCYKRREDAISYAKLLGKECRGEVRVFESQERRHCWKCLATGSPISSKGTNRLAVR